MMNGTPYMNPLLKTILLIYEGGIDMSELPVGDPDTFLGEFEQMDLSELKDKMFMVAISSGDPSKCKYIPESIHGPYGFYEMVEQVEAMWKNCQHHAKVLVTSKNMGRPPQFLDTCTVDYLEAKGGQIITEGMLGGDDLITDYTCKAGLFEAENHPLLEEKED